MTAQLTSVVTDPTTIPFPSGTPTTDEMVNMNTFGPWGLPAYQPGGSNAGDNNGPNVEVRRRVGYSKKSLNLTIAGENIWYGTVAIADLWLTYPANAGNSDLAVHIRTKRATPGGYGSISDDVQKEQDGGESNAKKQATGITDFGIPGFNYRGEYHKKFVIDWLNNAAEYGISVEDFFLTEAYLQAPGTAVQPAAQGTETSATWTGEVIAFDSATESIQLRGTEIGGDASVVVNFGNSPTVNVSLTDLRSARSRIAGGRNGKSFPTVYPDQSWTGLALSNGGFSDNSGGRAIEGTFRNQGTTTGTNANTVGGIFDVFGTMKGGFVATFGN